MKLNCIKANTTAAGHKALFGLLREQNDGSGRHIFVVPDRYTLGVEREICETLYPEGVFNVDVCSFTRLAQKALGRKNKTCLSKEGTVLLLNRVIEELGDKLVYYKNIKSVAFSREMFASIAAIRSSKIGADELGEKSNTVSGSIGDKLKDIALIYKAYEEELKGKYFDTVTRVDWLTENIGNSDYVKNSHIYILGFNVYSNAQLEFIKRAVIICPSVSISYCDGTNNHNSECFPMRQAEELLSYCEKAGVNIVIRESNEVLPEVFGFLHREMFAPGNAVFRGNSVESVKIDAEPNVYEEVKAAAREIRYLVFEREYRYKDIAVAVNNPDLTDLITKTFSRYGIPHFIDKKYAVKNGFFARFVSRAFACVGSGLDIRDVMPFVRHPYSGFCRAEIQIFENYCLKQNINYSLFRKPFTIGDFEVAESVRKKTIAFIEEIPLNALPDEYCGIIENWAQNEFINGKEKEFSESADTEERVYSDKEKYLGVIGEIKRLCSEKIMDAGEFSDMLSAVTENMTVSILPQYMDSVFVGNTSESRFNDVKALFVIGANDGYFPVTTGDKLVLGCYDTEIMRRNGMEVFPSPEETNFFEQFAVIDLVSKPEILYISYSLTAVDGTALSAGSAVREIKFRLGTEEKDFISYHGFSETEKMIYNFATPENCLFEYVSGGIPDEYAESARKYLVSEGLLPSTDNENVKADLLTGYSVTADGSYKISVSKMETYFKCPYKNFLTNILGLKEREEGELKVNEKGIIIHSVLEKYFSYGDKLRKMSGEKQAELAEKCVDEVLSMPEYARFFESAVSRNEIAGIKSECIYALKILTDNMLNSKFTPIMTEKRFGEGKELTVTAGGKNFVFYGFVDRVDSYGEKIIIIDYKTGRTEENLSSVYTGEKIQLYLYLKYFLGKGYKPCGVFYLPLSDGYGRKPVSYAMKGQMENDIGTFGEIDTRIYGAPYGKYGSSNVAFSANIKEDGITFANNNAKNLIPEEAFSEITEYVMRLCEKAAEEIIGGEKEKKPSEGACEYCAYKKICGEIKAREKVTADAASFYAVKTVEGEENGME